MRFCFVFDQCASALAIESANSRELKQNALQSSVNSDIGSPQNDEEREQKSKGRAARPIKARNTEAETHAPLRARSGFTISHVMRGPLQVIQLTTTYLSKLDVGTDVATCDARLSKSARSLKAPLDDLLDFNSTKLGLVITISPAAVDLAQAFSAELEQLRVANPDRSIELEVSGDVRGVWDINRLNQLLGNLVVNALKHGASSSPVEIVLNGLAVEVIFSVHNLEPKIERSVLAQIFEPLKRGLDHPLVASSDGSSMGLRLYIAREIAIAHHGDISAQSDEDETVFTVRLPRLSAKAVHNQYLFINDSEPEAKYHADSNALLRPTEAGRHLLRLSGGC
jgi:signal transduction histidine kinase